LFFERLLNLHSRSLQVQREGVRRDSIEVLKPAFSKAPEALDALDVLRASGEHIGPVLYAKVLAVAGINQGRRNSLQAALSFANRVYN
jgi:hypothetical protein